MVLVQENRNLLNKPQDSCPKSQAVENSRATLIFVSNEVGMGIVPLGAVSRYFVDNAGRMNQQLAQVCSRVTFVAAGLPLVLKE